MPRPSGALEGRAGAVMTPLNAAIAGLAVPWPAQSTHLSVPCDQPRRPSGCGRPPRPRGSFRAAKDGWLSSRDAHWRCFGSTRQIRLFSRAGGQRDIQINSCTRLACQVLNPTRKSCPGHLLAPCPPHALPRGAGGQPAPSASLLSSLRSPGGTLVELRLGDFGAHRCRWNLRDKPGLKNENR